MRKAVYMAVAALLVIAACNDEHKVTPAPEIYFSSSGSYEIAIDDTLTLSPRITYDENSTYTWLRDGEVVSNELEYVFIPDRMADYEMTFEVMNDNGADTSTVYISVLKHIEFDTFENFTIPKKARLILLPDSATNFIIDTTAVLNNSFNADTSMWYGFAYSSIVSVTTASVTTSCIGTAYTTTSSSSSQYMAMNCNDSDNVPIIQFNKGYVPRSIDIANDNYTFMVSRYGTQLLTTDSVTVTIGYMNTGDYITLGINGLTESGDISGTVYYSLVDCRTENSSHFTRLNDWTTVDLTSLGKVYGLYFNILCSRGIFPLYACIDNLKLQDE